MFSAHNRTIFCFLLTIKRLAPSFRYHLFKHVRYYAALRAQEVVNADHMQLVSTLENEKKDAEDVRTHPLFLLLHLFTSSYLSGLELDIIASLEYQIKF